MFGFGSFPESGKVLALSFSPSCPYPFPSHPSLHPLYLHLPCLALEVSPPIASPEASVCPCSSALGPSCPVLFACFACFACCVLGCFVFVLLLFLLFSSSCFVCLVVCLVVCLLLAQQRTPPQKKTHTHTHPLSCSVFWPWLNTIIYIYIYAL